MPTAFSVDFVLISTLTSVLTVGMAPLFIQRGAGHLMWDRVVLYKDNLYKPALMAGFHTVEDWSTSYMRL